MSYDFPFTILDVAEVMHLRMRRPHSCGAYYDCPVCGDNRGKMSINTQINTFRCNYCKTSGGMLKLYALTYGVSTVVAYREICEALQNGEFAPPSDTRPSAPVGQEVAVQANLADVRTIDQTFSLMLDLLTLNPSHREHLRNVRGLSDEQIDTLCYRSTPPFYKCRQIVKCLIEMGCTLEGVPGFYRKNGEWTVRFSTMVAGILIPVRGIDGLIRGMQIRLDQPIKDGDDPDASGTKYIWLSSAGKDMGVSSGSPVHFVGDPFARAVFITEGFLKADIAHYLMNRSFIAIAGVNNTAQLELMFTLLKENGTEIIVEAADMDKFRNVYVDKGVSDIYRIAAKCGLEFRRLTWNPNYKGIDDWQLALKGQAAVPKDSGICVARRFIYGLAEFEAIAEESARRQSLTDRHDSPEEYLGLSAEEYRLLRESSYEALQERLLAKRRIRHYRLYQLDFSDGKPKSYAFAGIKALEKAGYTQPPASDYALVAEGWLYDSVEDEDDTCLDRIFHRYNDTLPPSYKGRNLAPSDVVELYDDGGDRRCFYRDTDRFCEVRFSPMLAKKHIVNPK